MVRKGNVFTVCLAVYAFRVCRVHEPAKICDGTIPPSAVGMAWVPGRGATDINLTSIRGEH